MDVSPLNLILSVSVGLLAFVGGPVLVLVYVARAIRRRTRNRRSARESTGQGAS